ncbi:MAG: hypothetical protein HC945_02410 [Nitrosarchaeum sp.]|nr:hypothetical protein [Nitrosarchaeum sp.]
MNKAATPHRRGLGALSILLIATLLLLAACASPETDTEQTREPSVDAQDPAQDAQEPVQEEPTPDINLNAVFQDNDKVAPPAIPE